MKKSWSYEEVTESAEEAIRACMSLAKEYESEPETARIFRHHAFGAYTAWSYIVMGWIEDGDKERLAKLAGMEQP